MNVMRSPVTGFCSVWPLRIMFISSCVDCSWHLEDRTEATLRESGWPASRRAAGPTLVVRLAEEEAFAEPVGRIEDELVATGEVRTALDLGDHSVRPLLDHTADELAADDAQVPQRLAGRQPPL